MSQSGQPLELVSRTVSILNLVAARGPLTATEMARELGISKAGAFRVAQSLVSHNWLLQNPDRTYAAGPAMQGGRAGGTQSLIPLLRPFMERLHKATKESIHLTKLDGRHVTYVEQLVSPRPVRSVVTIGAQSPAHAVSPGIAQLAHLPPRRLDWFFANALPKYTQATIKSQPALREELRRVHERGWAVNVGGYRPDVGGVGCALIHPDSGQPVMALSICSPTYRLSSGVIAEYGELLRDVTAEAASLLARSPEDPDPHHL